MQTNTHTSSILCGEQRSKRFRYRHSVLGAAKEVGIPASWVWYWLLANRLKSRIWLRKIWLRLEAVQKLVANLDAVLDASYATGELLTSPGAIVGQSLDKARPYLKFQGPPKRPPQPARPNPVSGEEEKSEDAA